MIDKVRAIGLGSKGFIYCLIGILTALTAFSLGGKKTGKSGVIDYLQKQPFGKVILVIVGLGLLSYAFWRFYMAFADPKGKGDDASGIGTRIGYGFSGLIYLSFSVGVFFSAFGKSSGGSGGSSKQHFLSSLMQKSYGPIIIGIIGAFIICLGFYQIYQGYAEKYLKKLSYKKGSPPEFLKKTGMFGYIARGVVLGVTGYFFLRAAVTQNTEMVRGTKGALKFLQHQSFGTVLLAVVAIGLFAFGVFTFLLAKYSSLESG